MIKEEKTISGVVYTTQYAYDKNDFISTITYPSSRTVTYLPDDVRRVGGAKMSFNQQEKTLASSISYLPYGGVTGLTYGNGLTLTQQYDNQYRITSIVAGTGGSVLNRSYSVYDANGNVKKIMDVLQTTWNTAGESAETYSYELNASGNSNKNKLMGIQRSTSITFGYDFNGNITLANNRTYVYDLSNRLKEVLENTVSIAEYVYNGIGQRIIKDSQAGMRIFHYDPWGHLIAETNQAGNMLAEYIYLGDQLLAMVKPGEAVYYFHNDHLGTPQVITDAIGNVAWKATYTPFGQANITIGTVENNFRFPGQYYDSETGLHYNYYRYYDPTTGRYVTPDPIGLDGGINLFTYVAGNPLRWVDPLGLAWTDWQEVIATIEGTTAQGLRATTSYNFNTDTDFFVALPSEHLRGKRVEIQVNGIWVEVSVGDVGPWNGGHTFGGTSLDDPYWETNRRPQAECGTDLRGRPTNRGGIDISASLAKLLRLRGTTRERWRGVP